MTEFNLSEKIVSDEWGNTPEDFNKAIIAGHRESIDVEFIKEFIKLLKGILTNGSKITGGILDAKATLTLIDKLAGDELIK